MAGLPLEQLVEKLRVIVLSSAPLEEIPPKIDQLFDLWRRIEQGALNADSPEGVSLMNQLADVDLTGMRIMWEPLSDGVGDTITPSGWMVRAMLYLARGVPHWFVTASRAPDIDCRPTPEDDAVLVRIIGGLGGDPKRDLMRDTRLLETGWGRYFTWPHIGPLLVPSVGDASPGFYLAEEGADPKPGYEREPRLTWEVIEQLRTKN